MNKVNNDNKLKNHFIIILIGWLGFIGFDLFLHAGLLAQLYHETSPSILDPLQAFYRIPFGYLAFFLYVAFLYWLILKSSLEDINDIRRFSVIVGLFMAVSSTLAQYSILKINEFLLLGWGIGLLIEFLIIGIIMSYLLNGFSSKRMLLYVILFDLSLFLITVIMQNIGLAPPLEVVFRVIL